MKDLYVTWNQYHDLIEDLCVKVHDSGWEFDHILCLARGGLRIGDVFSRVFDKPLAILTTSSYREKDRKSTRLNSSHTDISRMPSSA